MQNLERMPVLPASGREVAPVREKISDRSAPDDFCRVMQRALAPKPKETPRELALRADKKHALSANEALRPDNGHPLSGEKKISGNASQFDDRREPDKPASTSANNSNEAIVPVLDLTAAPPLLQSLPSAAPSVTAAAAAVADVAKNIPAVTTAVAAEITGNAPPAAAESSPAESAAHEKAKSLAAELSPIKTAEIPTSPAADSANIEAVAAAFKNSGSTENSPAAFHPELTQTAAELADVAVATPAVEKGGTGVASVDVSMKKSANTNKVAGLDGKVLPSEAASTAREKVLPTATVAGPVRSADTNSTDANINLGLAGTFAAVDFSTAPSTLVLPALTDARMRNLERTHDMVALHAVRLLDAPTDTLSVVIKPGAGTELSLELRQRDGAIEAHAVLSRGDFQLMNEHWAELQQRLELRGIKLAPLGGEANFSTDGGGQFKQQQESSRELEAQKASAFAEFAVASRVVGATARLAIGGWESWA